MKACSSCNILKSLESFHKSNRTTDGRKYSCKACRNQKNKHAYAKNPEKRKVYHSNYYSENKDKYKNRHEKYSENLIYLEKRRETSRRHYSANPEYYQNHGRNWKKNNPGKNTANANKYRASKLKATPSWLTKEHLEVMVKLYEEAAALTKETGILHHVDHIHPLQGKTLCGLHVPWNLQILTATENLKKSNKV